MQFICLGDFLLWAKSAPRIWVNINEHNYYIMYGNIIINKLLCEVNKNYFYENQYIIYSTLHNIQLHIRRVM